MDSLFNNLWQSVSSSLVEILPQAPPFDVSALESMEPVMAMFNWVFPVDRIVDTLEGLLPCIGVYYGLQVVLRLLHVID